MTRDAIRSLLFVPGDSEAKAAKALAGEADAVILDLEDAVAPTDKPRAREVTRAVLDGARRAPVLVRVNGLDTGLVPTDLAAVLAGRPWGVVLPKADAAGVVRLGHYLDVLEAREGIAAGTTRILTVATETAAAVLGLAGVAAHPRLWGMMWGAEDLSAALGATTNRDAGGAYTFPFAHARAQCLYAAYAAGVVAVDAVFPDVRDTEGLARETAEGARDGFGAKAAIHPAQLPVINRLLTPDAAALDWARRVVAALADTGVARLDGRMVDIAHRRQAERLLARAATLGVR